MHDALVHVILPLLGAVVTERGGLLSHAAIVTRELGIPGAVDARGAMSIIPDGSWVRVDGGTGLVEAIGAPRGSSTRPEVQADGAAGRPLVQHAPPESLPRPHGQDGGRVEPLSSATDTAFGGKARALAAALAAGLPVADGVALDDAMVDAIAAGDEAARAAAIASVRDLAGP